MLQTIRTCFTALLLISLIWGCTDHLSRPTSPQRLRLKTVTSTNTDGTTTQTTFEYDVQNRLVAYNDYTGLRNTITYDAQNQYQQIDNSVSRTYFTYQSSQNGMLVTAKRYVLDVGERLVETYTYGFDAGNRLTNSTYVQGTVANPNLVTQSETTYAYTGDNITTVTVKALRNTRIDTYQYDDKPNPFYGLIGPGVDELRRFSRNNATQLGIQPTIVYEYNAQGLPTRIGDQTLTYESY